MTRSLRVLALVALLSSAAVVVKSTDAEDLRGIWERVRAWVTGEATGPLRTTWCPMDPQIVRKGPGMCPICNMELVPFEQGAQPEPGVLVLSDRQVQQAGVRLGVARVRDLVREIDATGRLEVNPAKRSDVVMPFPGQSVIEKIYEQAAGAHVDEGAVLMEVQNPALLQLLAEYRGVLEDIAEHRRAQDEEKSQASLARMKALGKEAATQGLTGSNLSFFASSPKFQFSDPAFPVYSPVSGTVLEDPKLYVGTRLSQGQRLFTVADLGELWVYIDLYEHERPFVAEGQTVEFTTLAVPDEVFTTTIRFIEPLVQRGTQTIRVQARVPNRDGELAPGMFVRARIACPVPEAMSVPESAVLQSGRRNVVIVAEGGGRFRPRIVELGRRHLFPAREDESAAAFGPDEERYHEVLGGLAPGERVVMAGNFLLNAEAQFQGVLTKMIEAHEAQANAAELEEEAEAAMASVFDAYFELTDALVRDDPAPLARIAEELARAATPTGDPGAAGGILQRIREEAEGLRSEAGGGEPDWDRVRTRYGSLSRELVAFLREYAPARVAKGQLHLFRCPMAEDFGFDLWLQREPGLQNPYMGQWMLECGTAAELE